MNITVYSFDSKEDLNAIVMFNFRGEAYTTLIILCSCFSFRYYTF